MPNLFQHLVLLMCYLILRSRNKSGISIIGQPHYGVVLQKQGNFHIACPGSVDTGISGTVRFSGLRLSGKPQFLPIIVIKGCSSCFNAWLFSEVIPSALILGT